MALLNIQNDITTSLHLGKPAVLTLLAPSAAFVTTDHPILYDCLKDSFGVDDPMLM